MEEIPCRGGEYSTNVDENGRGTEWKIKEVDDERETDGGWKVIIKDWFDPKMPQERQNCL